MEFASQFLLFSLIVLLLFISGTLLLIVLIYGIPFYITLVRDEVKMIFDEKKRTRAENARLYNEYFARIIDDADGRDV